MKAWLMHRRHRWMAGAFAVMIVVGASAVCGIVGAGSTPRKLPVAAPRETAQVSPVTASGTAPFTAPLLHAGLAPGAAILTSSVDSLDVFDAPDGAVTREIARYTRYARPLTLMAIDYVEVHDTTWYQVSLPAKPNGQTGWVQAADVAVSSTTAVIHVYLAEHELDLVVDGTTTLTAPVAVGSPATPTPLGTFYITDPIDLAADSTGVYGSYALGLSGYSEALDSFKGTPPQLAIHGTNLPGSIGKSVSNGCIRMNNDVVSDLGSRVGLGTPVIVSASRPGD